MQTLLIHNESAGNSQLTSEELLAALQAGGLVIRHCKPLDPALDSVLREPSDLVVLAGGDGTIARILAKLPPLENPDRKRHVAIVPLGTANNIAQSLGILNAANVGSGNEIVTAWKHADIQRLDVGEVTGPWGANRFVEAVGIGPLARTILQFKTEGVAAADSIRLGRAAFHHALKNADPLKSRLWLDNQPLVGDLLLAEVMNIQHAGSRVRLAPSADIGDGFFDVVTVAPDQRDEMLAWVAEGSDETPPPLTVKRAREVAIDWQGDPLRIDDYAPVFNGPAFDRPKFDRPASGTSVSGSRASESRNGHVSIHFTQQQLDILVPSLVDQQPLASRITVISS